MISLLLVLMFISDDQVFIQSISCLVFSIYHFDLCYVLILLLLDLLQVLNLLFALGFCQLSIFARSRINQNRPHNKFSRCCLLLESSISMDRLDDLLIWKNDTLHLSFLIRNQLDNSI